MAVKKKSNSKKKIVKKSTPKPKKQTKASSKKPEFEKAWKEYNSALSGWKESLAQWQKATNETLMTYHDACQKAIGIRCRIIKKSQFKLGKYLGRNWSRICQTTNKND